MDKIMQADEGSRRREVVIDRNTEQNRQRAVIGMGVGAGSGLKVTSAGTVPNLMVALTGGLH